MAMDSRIKSVEAAVRRFHSMNPIFLDTETTGTGPKAEIVDIAIIDLGANTLFQSLIRPMKRIPSDAIAIHGITNEMVKGAPTWGEAWPGILSTLEGKCLGIYNKEFDMRMMRQTCAAHGVTWKNPTSTTFCVMELFAEYYGEWNEYRRSFTWQRLETAGRHFQLEYPNSHRAFDDALLAKEVFLSMGNL
jgi:DNA polymerase-3 subunit epsilon